MRGRVQLESTAILTVRLSVGEIRTRRCTDPFHLLDLLLTDRGGPSSQILRPNEYSGHVSIAADMCTLNIMRSKTDNVHLGLPFLRRTTVAFATDCGRVGMCRTR